MSAAAPPIAADQPSARDPLRLVAEVALVGSVASSVALFGGALWEASAALAAGSAIACAAAFWSERRARQPFHFPALSFALLVGAGLSLLQLVPLPLSLLEVLSPRAVEVAKVSFGEGVSSAAISLDLAGTWKAIALQLSYALLCAAGRVVSADRAARFRVLSSLVGIGVVVSLVGYAHALAGLENLFGFALFTDARPPFVTPFGNANHLAGFLTLSCTVALGLFLSAERTAAEARPTRVAFGLAYALSGVAILLTLSRGGALAFLAAQLCFAFLMLRHRARSEGTRLQRTAVVGLCVGVVASVAGYAAYERIAAEWVSSGGGILHKVQSWPMMVAAAREFSLVGMGRGAFETAFPRFQTETPFVTFTHPENVLLQLWSELGVAGALLWIAALAWGLSKLRRKGRMTTADFGVVAGAVGVLVHNLADFSLELPAVMSAVVLALSMLARHEGLPRTPRPWMAPAAAVAALATICVALPSSFSTLARDEAQVAKLISGRAPPQQVDALVRAALSRHPAGYSLHALSGVAAARERPAAALAAFGRALALRPRDAYSHLGAARALVALGRHEQALLEYRLAQEAGGEGALDEALLLARSARDLEVLVGGKLSQVLPVADRAAYHGKRTEALGLAEAVLAQVGDGPSTGPLWLFVARTRLASGDVTAAAAALERVTGDVDPDARIALRADVLRRQGRADEARTLLREAVAQRPRSAALATSYASALAADGDYAAARTVLAAARGRVAGRDEKVQFLIDEAGLHEREGRYASALDLYRTAARMTPARAELHYAMAQILERMGRDHDALGALRQGLRFDHGEGAERVRERISVIEARLRAR